MFRSFAPDRFQVLNSTGEISQLCEQLINGSKARMRTVTSEQIKMRTFLNTIAPIMQDEVEMSVHSNSCEFPASVSTEKPVRDVANDCDRQTSAYSVELSMDINVYQAVRDYSMTMTSGSALHPEQVRFVERLLRDFKRDGLHLSDDVRAEVKTQKTRLTELCTSFSQNLNEDNTCVFVTADELEGMSDDFISSLKKEDDGRLKVTMKYPHLIPILQQCRVVETRRKIDLANGTRCKANIQLFEEAVIIRKKLSHLLGYSSHAAKVLEVRMAKTPERVMSFLTELRQKLIPGATAELQRLRDLKRKDVGPTGDDRIYSYDFQYYHQMLLKTEYAVDNEALKDYFPLPHVTSAMLSIYEDLLGLRLTVIKKNEGNNLAGTYPIWHDEVSVVEVRNRDDSQTAEPFGVFYLDLHPREGKYSHAAVFPLQKGCDANPITNDGVRQR
jgi:thimet oligopeptidase